MYAIIDVETTGLRPARDKIIELAVVIVDNEKIVEQFSTLVHPECVLPQYIVNLTSISDGMLHEAPKFYQVAKRLVMLLKNCTLVAHNARFDYSFLKKEFSELGYTFHRPVVCTVRLAREVLPGLPNYRLNTICQALGISVDGAHRALADALATAELFKRLQSRAQSLTSTILPPGLTRDQIQALPEGTGIYRFYNEKNEIVYIGKSKNIRKRVAAHFMPDHKSYKPVFYKDSVTRLEGEVLGSELLALLRESEEIKKHWPPLNRQGKRLRDHIGVYIEQHKGPHTRLVVKDIRKTTQQPVMSFSNLRNAKRSIERLAGTHGLCLRFFEGIRFDLCPRCGIRGCDELLSPEVHNRMVTNALKPFRYPATSFLIEEEGLHPNSRSLMVIHDNRYLGSLQIEEGFKISSFEDLQARLARPEFDLVDAREIIVSYLNQNADCFQRSRITIPAVNQTCGIKALYFKLKPAFFSEPTH